MTTYTKLFAQKQFLEELKRQMDERTLSDETIIEFADRVKLLGLFLKTLECVSEDDMNDVDKLLKLINEIKAYYQHQQQPIKVQKKKSWIRRWFNRII